MSDDPNIALCGPMGVGKTAVARLLGAWLDRQWVDTDELVARATGKTVARVFAEDGEAAFRALEADAVQAVSERRGLVVALGGGAVLDPRNVMRLRASGWVVHLDAAPEVLAARVEGGRRSRPLLDGVDDVVAELARLRQERAEAYADAAHVTVDVDEHPLEVVAAMALRALEDAQEARR